MRRAFVIVRDAIVRTLRLDRMQHAFEFTDEKHVLIDTNDRILAERFDFFGERRGILAQRNFRRFQYGCFSFFGRINDECFRHVLVLETSGRAPRRGSVNCENGIANEF